MRVRKAVIPAAGFGTRFLPATKTVPKEMLPIVDKPVIQYIVEEAVRSGIEEIILVTSTSKKALEDFSTRLRARGESRGDREDRAAGEGATRHRHGECDVRATEAPAGKRSRRAGRPTCRGGRAVRRAVGRRYPARRAAGRETVDRRGGPIRRAGGRGAESWSRRTSRSTEFWRSSRSRGR